MAVKGRCLLCGLARAKGPMGRHVIECAGRSAPSPSVTDESGRFFHLLVEGRGDPGYWLHLDARASASLQALDTLLRRTWLECCGHLSAFEIGGRRYASHLDPDWPEERGMSAPLERVLDVGTRFYHEYDFGTTTHLALRVVAVRDGAIRRQRVRLLARNEPLPIACGACGSAATLVCAYCESETDRWLCDRCVDAHECSEEGLLPLVNSPRVGQCGYTGAPVRVQD